MYYKCYNESIPSHTRLALNEFTNGGGAAGTGSQFAAA